MRRWLELPAYSHLPGYLHRWSVARIGALSVRLHRIFAPDATPFLHNHPFAYVSVVLRGGYTERVLTAHGILVAKRHRPGKLIIRSAHTAHRIEAVEPGCLTLFFAWRTAKTGAQGWSLQRHPAVVAPASYLNWQDGLYRHGAGFRKRKNGVWYVLGVTKEAAVAESRVSIHQQLNDVTAVVR